MSFPLFPRQILILITIVSMASRLPCYVFCICLLTNKYQKYKSVELGDQLDYDDDDCDKEVADLYF